MAYARPDMDEMACSEDVLRVVPNPDRILPGYVYAFLSSKFGESLVVGGTYGAIIQHIEPHHIADLHVPRLGRKIEMHTHELVKEAAELRTRASRELSEAILAVGAELQAPTSGVKLTINSNRHDTVAYASELRTTWRLDGFYYNPIARAVEAWARSHQNTRTTLGDLCEVFDVPPFKHIYVEEGWGIPFFTSGEIFLLERKARKFLSKTQTKGLEKYILQRGWILLARSGQLGGIIGRPQFTDSALHEAATSDHVIRIAPRSSIPAGYLFAYLANEHIGYPLLTRTMAGKSVPALWPQYLQTMSVVLAVHEFMENIDLKVQNAFELRVRASSMEAEARSIVESAIEEAS
jgi:type I restriction enzyme S subunit